jgi:ubiquinone/menaquinone biosynthesis C-methylase UbiE
LEGNLAAMKNKASDWMGWWKTEAITRDANWRKNMEIFLEATEPILLYGSQDTVLDIGCGPCHFASSLKDRVKEIHSVDISERYLNFCQSRFKNARNVFFHKLNENNYTDLSCIKHLKFSIIVCLSVIQYYNDIDDVKRLIEEARGIALPGARLLIADIPTSNGMFFDLLGMLATGFREKYFMEGIKFMYRARNSTYHQMRSSVGLLSISVTELNDLISQLNLNARILRSQMTINKHRKHLLIKF